MMAQTWEAYFDAEERANIARYGDIPPVETELEEEARLEAQHREDAREDGCLVEDCEVCAGEEQA